MLLFYSKDSFTILGGKKSTYLLVYKKIHFIANQIELSEKKKSLPLSQSIGIVAKHVDIETAKMITCEVSLLCMAWVNCLVFLIIEAVNAVLMIM